MDPFFFTLLLGFAGLGFMAMAGLHQGSGGHGHAHGHDVGDVSLGGHHAHGALPAAGGAHHAGLPAHGHGGHAELGHGQDHTWDLSHRVGGFLLSLLSPRVLSALLLGFGATGLLVGPWLGGVPRVLAAVAGALAIEMGVVSPMWRLLSGFASPARTLESAVMEPALAACAFDANGQGLVAVEVDGQVTQILGTLRPADRELGVRVRAGDRLLVEEVDPQRNRCVVSYLGS